MKKTTDIIFNISLLSLCLGIIGGALWYAEYSDQLTLKNISIRGNHLIKTATIEEAISAYLGSSIESTDVKEIQHSLRDFDYISDVNVSRVFPATLAVRVLENRPVAYIHCSDGQVSLGCHGEILPVTRAVKDYYKVPLVEGITDQFTAKELQMTNSTGIMRDILQIVNCLNTNCDSLMSWVAVITVTRDRIQLQNKRQRQRQTAITLNRDKFVEDTLVLDAFVNSLTEKQKLEDFEYIDLTIPNQIIVKEKRT